MIAFLTIEPINPGHTLVVPKIPFVNLFDGEEEILGRMTTVAKRIGNALINQGYATGINLIMNNGADAGQVVFHAHLHVVPRKPGDNAFEHPKYTATTPEEITQITATLKTALT